MSNKFNLLYEHIISELKEISEIIDTFNYKFSESKNQTIICEFETLNDDGELIKVNAYILSDGTIKFELINDEIKKQLSEKSFMIKYYKDYEKFKKALNKYEQDLKKDKTEEKNIKTDKSKSNINMEKIPQITSFNTKLNKIVRETDSEIIKANGINFEFQFIEDSDDKKLLKVIFLLINDSPKNDELDKYKVIGLVKLLKENSVPIKFLMINPDQEEDRFEISKTNFQEKFPEYFDAFLIALNKFEFSER